MSAATKRKGQLLALAAVMVMTLFAINSRDEVQQPLSAPDVEETPVRNVNPLKPPKARPLFA